MKVLKILFLFIVLLSGCNKKYLANTEEGIFGQEWSVLDTEVAEQDNVGFTLNLNVKDFVEVKDSVKLSKLYESRRGRAGSYKILGGCAIAGCTALGIGWAAMSYMNDPYEGFGHSVACLGIVGGVGTLYFIVSGVSDIIRFDKEKPYYIRKNIICKNSTPLRNDEVRIMLKNTSSEKIYYTDGNGIIHLKFDEFIPEPTEADSVLNLIIQYEEMADSVKVRRL